MRGLKEFNNHPVSYRDAQRQGLQRGICVYVVDGDTVDVLVDMGYRNYHYTPIRIANVDTPEIRGVKKEEKARGMEARAIVEKMILNQPVLIDTTKQKQSFTRWEGDVYFLEGEHHVSVSDRIKYLGLEK